MGVEKKRCPRCKKRRAKPSVGVQSTKFGDKHHLTWREVDGQVVCRVCQEKETEDPPTYAVSVKSCPRKVFKRAVEVLTPRFGLVASEEMMTNVFDRTVAVFDSIEEAQGFADVLTAAGCETSVSEVASFP